MSRASRMHKHLHAFTREMPGTSRMIEMNVRDKQRAQITRLQSALGKLRAQRIKTHRATALA